MPDKTDAAASSLPARAAVDPLPVFLSVVLVLRNEAARLPGYLEGIGQTLAGLVSDYEIIVVDNASDDATVAVLKGLTGETGQPNLQAFVLTKEVDTDTASWVGLESALGDFVAVMDPATDSPEVLQRMLDQAVRGADVVFGVDRTPSSQGLAYRLLSVGFHLLYRWFNGIHLALEAPRLRVLSRRVINFVLQHPAPALTYRHLPASSGFARAYVDYDSGSHPASRKPLGESVDRGVRMLVSTTRGPMRLVTWLSLFGAVSNVLYSFYVFAVFLLKEDVAPGWTTLSLQQSGMFLLISVVLLVLGEYILQMASLSNEGPRYHVAQEFTSVHLTRRQRLNVEEAGASRALPQHPA